jgi:hypothetical protein
MNTSTFRLNEDGSRDFDFADLESLYGPRTVVSAQPDGKLLVSGGLSWNKHQLFRTHQDGTLDSTFVSDIGFNDNASCFLLQPDGRIIVGGEFTTFDSIPRHRIVRLLGDPLTVPEISATSIFIYHGLDAIHVMLGEGIEPRGTIRVMDITGRLIHTQGITSDHSSVYVSPTQGIYIVQAETVNQTLSSKIFIP